MIIGFSKIMRFFYKLDDWQLQNMLIYWLKINYLFATYTFSIIFLWKPNGEISQYGFCHRQNITNELEDMLCPAGTIRNYNFDIYFYNSTRNTKNFKIIEKLPKNMSSSSNLISLSEWHKCVNKTIWREISRIYDMEYVSINQAIN